MSGSKSSVRGGGLAQAHKLRSSQLKDFGGAVWGGGIKNYQKIKKGAELILLWERRAALHNNFSF